MQDLQQQIEAARDRIRGLSDARVTTDIGERISTDPAAMHVERHYGPEYWNDEVEWLPPRASLTVSVKSTAAQEAHGSCEAALTLCAGPSALYRYFPFCVNVYVDDRLAAIYEFGREFEEQTALLTLPVGKAAKVLIVSELSDMRRFDSTNSDKRALAVMLKHFRVDHYHSKGLPAASLDAGSDYVSQWRRPLVSKLPEPVFVIGAYRSGTSILTWAIGQHPNIWPLEETGWLHLLGSGAQAGFELAKRSPRSFFDLYDVAFQEYMAHLGGCIDHFMRTVSSRRVDGIALERTSGKAENIFGRFDENFQLARSLFGQKTRWVDGTPENAGNMLLLKTLFPRARFVCIVRDPFDVVSSMVHFERAGGSSMSIDQAAAMWLRMIGWTIIAARAFGSDAVKFIRYEHLVADPAISLRSVFDFLGEARFPKAAATYGTRINSSKLSRDERAAIRADVASSQYAEDLSAKYDEALSFVDSAWSCDEAAEVLLMESQQDIVHRLIEEFA